LVLQPVTEVPNGVNIIGQSFTIGTTTTLPGCGFCVNNVLCVVFIAGLSAWFLLVDVVINVVWGFLVVVWGCNLRWAPFKRYQSWMLPERQCPVSFHLEEEGRGHGLDSLDEVFTCEKPTAYKGRAGANPLM